MNLGKNKLLSFVIVVLMGVAYVFLLNIIGSLYSDIFPVSPDSPNYQKMISTGVCSILTVLIIYAVNVFLLKRNSLHIGMASAVMATLYFVVIRSDDSSILEHVFTLLNTGYSLVAMLFFIGLPLLVGALLHKAELASGTRTS